MRNANSKTFFAIWRNFLREGVPHIICIVFTKTDYLSYKSKNAWKRKAKHVWNCEKTKVSRNQYFWDWLKNFTMLGVKTATI